jgi:RNA polymerase sigma-70 factor (ECF subfamily)
MPDPFMASADPAPRDDDERALVERLRGGDERAFVELVRSLDGLLRRLARGVAAADLIDEIVQDTWVGVVRGLASFEGRSTLRTWICRILLNRARSAAVRAGRTVPFSALGTDDDADDAASVPDRFSERGDWAVPPSPWADERPEALVGRAELLGHVTRAIDELPERQRLVLVLREVEGWTSEEVCNALDLTETNQRVLLHRARGRIRAALDAQLAPTEPQP